MITYELAKRLKEAGFPYKEESYKEIYPPGVEMIPGNYIGAGMSTVVAQGQVRLPVFTELVRACGDRLGSLHNEKSSAIDGNKWWAWEDESYGEPKGKEGLGSSPEEAVAELWLALNRK